ncbi:phenylacetyl-CoA ligase [Artomyces pyxidatus]|uniref:Phenylacetyl-CoA ligase n=1 Tax=Artomyces pyxidatus TaxID=48021 RepID=A0ACB8TDH6_9AGAM|nr:phenylacetyl-CoA ligase [Artomyces pyxidatus]
MSEVLSKVPLGAVPDNLTIPQFFLDYKHPLKSTHKQNAPYFIDDKTGKQYTEKDVLSRVHGLANGLSRKWNIGEGDVVCIFSPNHIDYPIAIWAVHRLGGIITGSNPAYTVDELIHQLKLTNAATVVTQTPFLGPATQACKAVGIPAERIVLLDEAPRGSPHVTIEQLIADGVQAKQNFVERKLAPGEAKTRVAFFSLSSGTTGPPKAVVVGHYAVIANVLQMTTHNAVVEEQNGVPPADRRFRSGDLVTGVLPFFHIYGLVMGIHQMMFNAITVVVIPKFSWPDFLETIVKYHIQNLIVVPPMIVLLCKHPATKKYDLSFVHLCYSGAAPLSGSLIKDLSQVLPNAHVGQGYGMTETATAVTMTPPMVKVGWSGTAGSLLPGVKVRVVTADGKLAGMGEPGELVVWSPSNALRYHNNTKATDETFLDGWVRTGDEVVYDEKGEITIVDRLKELIKVRGFQVAPAELEGHLLTHPDVADVCVVAVPDDFSGELPFAFIVLHEAAAARAATEGAAIKAALAKYVSDVKTNYKWLAGGVEFIDVIPKNPSGKLLRRVLKVKAKEILKAKPLKSRL